MTRVLILYYSEEGATQMLARAIANGVESVDGCRAVVRTVAPLGGLPSNGSSHAAASDNGCPLATRDDLALCDALALGSPGYFGNMAAALKSFLETQVDVWFNGELTGKPAAVFTATGSQHGGQETTLLSMMIPLLHHGMMIVGVPSSVDELNTTRSGGSLYGATHVSGGVHELSSDERVIARALGRRLSETARKLQEHP